VYLAARYVPFMFDGMSHDAYLRPSRAASIQQSFWTINSPPRVFALFPYTTLFRSPFPAELLPYVFFRKPKMVYTVDSTACENLRRHFQIEKLYPESEEGERP